MEEQNSKLKIPQIPKLGLAKVDDQADQAHVQQMTSREEQEQYKLRGIQDGKVEELINHEKRAEENQRKMLTKENSDKKVNARRQELADISDDESVQERQEQQDKKKKRKKRKKNKGAEPPTPQNQQANPKKESDPKNNDRF